MQAHSFSVPSTQVYEPRAHTVIDTDIKRIAQLLRDQNAVVIAHYYTDPECQMLAEATDGFVGDSLSMAQFALQHSATTLVVIGVRFMGETAKILNPDKRVLVPTLAAECSLDLGCPPKAFADFCVEHPDRTRVVYVNTSAQVKAMADWVVTSSNALAIVDHLDAQGEKILWAPDRYLGRYIQEQTQADMILWQGACIVHEEFRAQGVKQLKQTHPQAVVLAHPESPADVLALADVVGSTSRLLQASQEHEADTFIVATDRGIFYKMKQLSPNKQFLEAPTAGVGATCRSCAHCPWMAMNNLALVEDALITGGNEIVLPPHVIAKARQSVQRMVEFKC